VQTPIAPPYAEAISRRRAEKSASTSDHSSDFSETDIKTAIEHENESSVSGIKWKLSFADDNSDNKPSVATKIVQDEDNEEETIIDGLQNLYQLDTSDYDFSEINVDEVNEYENESLASEIKRTLVISTDNDSDKPNMKTTKDDINKEEKDIDTSRSLNQFVSKEEKTDNS